MININGIVYSNSLKIIHVMPKFVSVPKADPFKPIFII